MHKAGRMHDTVGSARPRQVKKAVQYSLSYSTLLVAVLWLALSLAGGRDLGAVISTADTFAASTIREVSVQLKTCLYSLLDY